MPKTLSGKIIRKKVKKPPAPPAKSNPTGRAKIGDRKLDTGVFCRERYEWKR